MAGMVARGSQAVAGGQEVEGTQKDEAIQGAAEGICWPKATLGMLPRDGQTHSAQCDPEGQSLLRTAVQTLNTETTPKTADWSQPIEVDDSLPIHLATLTRLQKQQTGHNPKRGTSGACQYWTPKWRRFLVGRSLRMTLVCGSGHPSPPLLIPITGLHGELSRLQCLLGGPNWQVSQAEWISTS